MTKTNKQTNKQTVDNKKLHRTQHTSNNTKLLQDKLLFLSNVI